MSSFLDFSDRPTLHRLLQTLAPDTPARWGRLQPQSMVEHLVEAVEYTNGTRTGELVFSPEVAEKEKQFWVYTPAIIPPGVVGGLTDTTLYARYADLPTALLALKAAIDAFEAYFETPGQTALHQAFGNLTYQEWLIWHGKHFAHHLRQFGLV